MDGWMNEEPPTVPLDVGVDESQIAPDVIDVLVQLVQEFPAWWLDEDDGWLGRLVGRLMNGWMCGRVVDEWMKR